MGGTKELTEADLYHVFAVENRGDTLVIAPRGDAASFPEAQFRMAVGLVRERLARTPSSNLIVDLSEIEYPGLTMLSAFAGLIDHVRGRGGTAAVAGASPDTLRVISEYGYGSTWSIYPARRAALAAVVHEPLLRKVWRRRVPLTAAVAVFLPIITGAAILAPGTRERDRQVYMESFRIWHDYRRVREAATDESNLATKASALALRADRLARRASARGVRTEVTVLAQRIGDMTRTPRVADDPRDEDFFRLAEAARRSLEESRW